MKAEVFVKVRDVPDPRDFPEELERALTLQLLTQTGPVPVEFVLTPAATQALRDTLRTGRKVSDTIRQLEAIQAAHGAMIDRCNRALRRQVRIWILSSLAIWTWAIWVTLP